MNEIRPGILVEIVASDAPEGEAFIGHIGMVLRESEIFDNAWIVEGAERVATGALHWKTSHLRPINDGTIDKLIEKWQRESRQGVPA